MENRQILLNNLAKIHTTEMGTMRIKKNLRLDVEDVIGWCVEKIKNRDCKIIRNGKNWYAKMDDLIITINANSYTIITAHRIK